MSYFASVYGNNSFVRPMVGMHSVSAVLKPVHPAADSKILSKISLRREYFDATNATHRNAFYSFRNTGKWSMKFYNEFPYNDVVATITAKMLTYIESIDHA